MTRTRSEHLTRRIPRSGDASTHNLCVSAPPVERTIYPASVRTARRPGFTGRIALFGASFRESDFRRERAYQARLRTPRL